MDFGGPYLSVFRWAAIALTAAVAFSSARRFRASHSFNRWLYGVVLIYCIATLVALALTRGSGGIALSVALTVSTLLVWGLVLSQAHVTGSLHPDDEGEELIPDRSRRELRGRLRRLRRTFGHALGIDQPHARDGRD